VLVKAIISIFLLVAGVSVQANQIHALVGKVRAHYQHTLPIKAFSLNHHYLNKRYRSRSYWDFRIPNRHMSQRVVELDLEKKHFYDNDLHYSSGGRLSDFVQFQNGSESLAYEKNGSSYGKLVRKQSMDRFDQAMGYFVMNLDFIAVRPLLEESNINKNISLSRNHETGTVTLKHTTAEGKVVDYEFNESPLLLKSVKHSGLGGIFVYDNYQTTRGITYARTVYQYYGGATEPNYIIYNDQFSVIDQVDPAKLTLPPGYGGELPKRDGVLVAKEIADELYVVTDSSANRNSLLKVNGEKIMIFGASGYPELAEKTLTLIREQFPNKEVSSVYVTHPHDYEIAGLKTYAEQGIEILADDYTISAIKSSPDFADDIHTFQFRTIEHEQVINGAQFYVLENMHVKRQSFAHFKDSGILYQSDFLHIPYDNTIAKVTPSYTRTFINFVRDKKLNISRIVGAYRNNDISVEVMNKTFDAMM